MRAIHGATVISEKIKGGEIFFPLPFASQAQNHVQE